MFGLGKKKDDPIKVAAGIDAPTNPNLAGALSLTKGDSISLHKTDLIRVECSWTDSTKDYDLMALVRFNNGVTKVVNYKNLEVEGVKLLGDVKGAGSGGFPATEVLEIRLTSDIASVAPFAYSARENGSGSFRQYGVSVLIDTGDEKVSIQAADASTDGSRYTLCFGEIINGGNQGPVLVKNLELYSGRGSEKQPAYSGSEVIMDAGPSNPFK